MDVESCIKRISAYLDNENFGFTPRLVNVQNIKDLSEIKGYFEPLDYKKIYIWDYANKDQMSKIDELKRAISTSDRDVFVIGVTSHLMLKGKGELRNELLNFASKSYGVHVVVLCYQCGDYLKFDDPRLKRLVYSVDGEASKLPKLIFHAPGYALPDAAFHADKKVDGIEAVAQAVEEMDGGTLVVKTRKHKTLYSASILKIKEISSPYEALVMSDSDIGALDKDLGTDEEWQYALSEVSKKGSFSALINEKFGAVNKLARDIKSWNDYDHNDRWLYFAALKLYGASGNKCLDTAVKNCESADKLLRNIYRSLLEVPHTDPTFWKKYDERKNLIKSIVGSDKNTLEFEAGDYVQVLNEKGKDALYYLTDSSQAEKEKILKLLKKYADISNIDKAAKVLEHVYPYLYSYLQPYNFKNDELNDYFQRYKVQKVINDIEPEFLKVVEEQAKRRDFNKWLPTRSEKVDELDKNGSKLYFIDALGVEYLSFIMARCKKLHMRAAVTICRCELPSITINNKDPIIEEFTRAQAPIDAYGELDDIKHNGKTKASDDQETILPFYMIDELEIINGKLSEISNELKFGSIKKAYIISDHGASRLAVIHNTENMWEMSEKGKHSGRCCLKSDADVQSEYATEEIARDGKIYWVLANYDRFKGSRKANVEVHGGATLEEVTVPIIELTYADVEIEVKIHSKLPIEVSGRKKAELQIFSKTKLENVEVLVLGEKFKEKRYPAEPLDNNLYLIRMPDLRRPGDYNLTVLSDGNEIAKLNFSVKAEGMAERKMKL